MLCLTTHVLLIVCSSHFCCSDFSVSTTPHLNLTILFYHWFNIRYSAILHVCSNLTLEWVMANQEILIFFNLNVRQLKRFCSKGTKWHSDTLPSVSIFHHKNLKFYVISNYIKLLTIPWWACFSYPVCQVSNKIKEKVSLWHWDHFVCNLDKQAEAFTRSQVQALRYILTEVLCPCWGINFKCLS